MNHILETIFAAIGFILVILCIIFLLSTSVKSIIKNSRKRRTLMANAISSISEGLDKAFSIISEQHKRISVIENSKPITATLDSTIVHGEVRYDWESHCFFVWDRKEQRWLHPAIDPMIKTVQLAPPAEQLIVPPVAAPVAQPAPSPAAAPPPWASQPAAAGKTLAVPKDRLEEILSPQVETRYQDVNPTPINPGAPPLVPGQPGKPFTHTV